MVYLVLPNRSKPFARQADWGSRLYNELDTKTLSPFTQDPADRCIRAPRLLERSHPFANKAETRKSTQPPSCSSCVRVQSRQTHLEACFSWVPHCGSIRSVDAGGICRLLSLLTRINPKYRQMRCLPDWITSSSQTCGFAGEPNTMPSFRNSWACRMTRNTGVFATATTQLRDAAKGPTSPQSM